MNLPELVITNLVWRDTWWIELMHLAEGSEVYYETKGARQEILEMISFYVVMSHEIIHHQLIENLYPCRWIHPFGP